MGVMGNDGDVSIEVGGLVDGDDGSLERSEIGALLNDDGDPPK